MNKLVNIELKNLEIGYDQAIVTGITSKIESGELIGLIGENGAGKSTLLKTLAGFIQMLDGEIVLNNERIQNISQERFSHLMSIVTTKRVAISHFKVEDLVSFGRFPYRKWISGLSKKDKEIILQCIKEVQAEHLLGKDINELSDGEYQRVMIARCLAQNTPIILLDEPTAFLDLNGKYEIVNLLQTLANKNGKIIIFSSHDLSMAIKFVSKIWFIASGSLIEETPEDLILTGQIDEFISSPLLKFNAQLGDLECKFHLDKGIALQGEELTLKWTENALNKLGYAVTNEISYPSLQIVKDNNYFKWIFKQDNVSKEIEFNSMKELTLFLKRLT